MTFLEGTAKTNANDMNTGLEGEHGLSLALLGHDLRAVLGDMRTGLSLLQRHEVPDALRDKLDRCRAAGDALSRLIDQSVLVCLGQGSPTTSAPVQLNLQGFLSDLRQRWAGRAADSGHRFSLVAAGNLPDHIVIDRTALERVLGNLIANALHHTPPCPVTLTFKISGDDLLLIAVEDGGPGFPPMHLDAIQKDFVLPEHARRPGGGFGLQSVKLLVETLGGRCHARNKASGGAEVSVCLPLAMTADTAPPPSLAPVPDLSGTRLLLADDSASSRELISLLSHHIGAAIVAVPDGKAAIDTLAGLQAQDLPDVVLLDSEMPGASGIDVLNWLQRQADPWASLPVLALTSHIDPQKVDALLQAGAAAVLAKPVLCPLELGRALLAVQGKTDPGKTALAKTDAIKTTPVKTPENGPETAALNRLRQLAGPEAAAELFEKLQEDLESARSGLAKAADLGDLAAIRRHSHVLIALAGTAGALDLHDAAVTLNTMAQDSLPLERTLALLRKMDSAILNLVGVVRALASQPFPADNAP